MAVSFPNNCLNKGMVDVTASTGETATLGGGLVGSVMKETRGQANPAMTRTMMIIEIEKR